MIVENPKVTLEEEIRHGVQPEDAPAPMVSAWAIHAKVDGDDGKQYWIDTILCAGWGFDVRVLSVRTGEGKVIQLPDSIYKIVDFPPPILGLNPLPRGELRLAQQDDRIMVAMPGARIDFDDGTTWHYSCEDEEKGIKLDCVHTGIGFPTWYGKETPQAFSPHSIAYGYFWSGRIEGTLTINGRDIRITGKGGRERTFMPDSCPAESASWHEWIWYHFDELFGTSHEMKLNSFKDGSLYLIDEQQFFPYRSFNVEHQDWAYHPELGSFIPTRFRVTVETEAGVLEYGSRIVGAALWAITGAVPDFPFALLHWDEVEGTFTYKDGRKRTLTNGRAHSIARQWKPYPRILSPEALGIPAKLANTPIL
jgi:hypothetical protein